MYDSCVAFVFAFGGDDIMKNKKEMRDAGAKIK